MEINAKTMEEIREEAWELGRQAAEKRQDDETLDMLRQYRRLADLLDLATGQSLVEACEEQRHTIQALRESNRVLLDRNKHLDKELAAVKSYADMVHADFEPMQARLYSLVETINELRSLILDHTGRDGR